MGEPISNLYRKQQVNNCHHKTINTMHSSRISLLAGLLILASVSLVAQNVNGNLPEKRIDRLRQNLYYLASDSLRGRGSGSEDARKAAAYIREQYEAMGLEPYNGEWEHFFQQSEKHTFLDIVGIIPGNDPVLKDEYIVLGAHYDHLGVKNDSIYNGADDNASGSVALIEIARDLCNRKADLKRSVIIAAFDGEELGLHGSNFLSDILQDEGLNIRLMMSIDMVGWLAKGGALKLEGTGTIKKGKEILTEAASALSLPVKLIGFEKSLLTATDTEGFAKKGIPTLAVTTGLKSPYHKPGDDPELIDYEGLDVVCQYLTDITTRFAIDESFGPSGRLSFKYQQRSDSGLEFGLAAGFNTSRMVYPHAAFEGVGDFGWNGGVTLRANMKRWGLLADVYYDAFTTPLPDAADPYNSMLEWKHQSLTVPVNIIVQTPRSNGVGAFIGAGAFYNYTLGNNISTLDGNWSSRNQEVGFCWCFGFNIYNLTIKDTFLMGVGNALSGEGAPSPARSSAAVCSLCWYF